MKNIYLTKHPSLLKDAFVEIKVHSDHYKIGHDFQVWEYGTDNYLTTAQLVAKETKMLDDITDWDAFMYYDCPKEIVKKIWRSRVKNHDRLLFDVLLFSSYMANNKFLELNEANMHLYKDLCNPIKNHGHVIDR